MPLDPTQLQSDYAALAARFIGSNYTKAMFNDFRAAFMQLLDKHHLDDLKYAYQRPDTAVDRNTMVIIPLTTASEIVLLYMMGLL